MIIKLCHITITTHGLLALLTVKYPSHQFTRLYFFTALASIALLLATCVFAKLSRAIVTLK